MDTLFISDLDGTLLGADSQVSHRSAALLNEVIGSGVLFSVATARTPATVDRLLANVDCRIPLIVMTGAAIWDRQTGKYIHACFHDESTARELISVYKRAGLSTFIYTLGNDNIIHIYHMGEMSGLEMKFVAERADSPYKQFHIPQNGDSDIPNQSLSRVLLFYTMRPTEEVQGVYNQIKDRCDLRAVFYHDIFGESIALMEVFSPDSSKANAVRILAERLHANHIVAYGDNVNDIPILEMADESVAVANAVESVKRLASRVIGPNTTDSVAKDIHQRAMND